ncbi:MAG: hypothetical protein IKP81_03090 [Paludibacteraceae bacterium]|nr:hypothetical protein [Paludibacteraceae bacterium]MBR6042449.1 hypothetical protein [Paludibacteraceae bacterium]MBR6104022.1 hypothetical protein [Paludibacteraceae bacterium]
MLAKNCQIEVYAGKLRRRSEENCRNAQGDRTPLSNFKVTDIVNASAISIAKEMELWLSFQDVVKLGVPIPSGVENDVYLSEDGNTVYKVNNLMLSHSVLELLDRLILHNSIFPQTRYELYGFTGFSGNSVYPILTQDYIKDVTFSSPSDIKDYMTSLGFSETAEACFSNGDIEVSDLYPRNVLKDLNGDMYVVDANYRIL